MLRNQVLISRRIVNDFLLYGRRMRENGICPEHCVIMMGVYTTTHRRSFYLETEMLETIKVMIWYCILPLMRDWIRSRT